MVGDRKKTNEIKKSICLLISGNFNFKHLYDDITISGTILRCNNLIKSKLKPNLFNAANIINKVGGCLSV